MKTPLIIFGMGDIAQIAHVYFANDSSYEIVAFTVDRSFLKEDEFCGCTAVAFEEIEHHFPPSRNEMFVALSYSKLNRIRREKYLAAKAKGYRMASYISPHATVLNEGNIGDNCFIFEDNTIQPFVSIGSNVNSVEWKSYRSPFYDQGSLFHFVSCGCFRPRHCRRVLFPGSQRHTAGQHYHWSSMCDRSRSAASARCRARWRVYRRRDEANR